MLRSEMDSRFCCCYLLGGHSGEKDKESFSYEHSILDLCLLIHNNFLAGPNRLPYEGYKFASDILKIGRTRKILGGWNNLNLLAAEDHQTPGTWPPVATVYALVFF